MKRILMSFIFMVCLNAAMMPQADAAVVAKSQTYTIGATIPAIPGVNAPAIVEEGASFATADDATLVLLEQQTIRNNEEVVLMTFVGN